MSEYIERNTLLEAIKAVEPDETMDLGAGAYMTPYFAALEVFDNIKHEIKAATPADVAPVVHGHWKYVEDDVYTCYKCSACGSTLAGDKSRYCPGCGAKMDESEGKNNGRV